MNNYKEYLLKQLPSHLRQMESEDRVYNNSITVKSVYLQSFFDYFLHDIKLSPSELVLGLKDSILPEILYSSWYDKYEQREEWIERLTPAQKENIDFFKSCLQQCLTSHAAANNYIDEEIRKERLANNLKNFTDLLDLGLNAGHFDILSQTDLITSYSIYQGILQEKNIFRLKFDFADFKASLNDDKKPYYFHSFVESAIDFFSDNPDKINEMDDKTLKKFIGQVMNVRDNTYVEIQKNFLEKLMEIQSVRKIISEDYKKEMFDNFQSLIPLYFEKLLPSEREDMLSSLSAYQFPHGDLINNYGSGLTGWISQCQKGGSKTFVEFEAIDALATVMERFSLSPHAKYFGNRITICLVAHNIGLTQKEPEILKYIEENIERFNIDFSHDKIARDVVSYAAIWKLLEKNNSPQLKSLRYHYDQQLEKVIDKTITNDAINKYEKLDCMIHSIPSYSALEKITEDQWKKEINITIETRSEKTHKTIKKNVDMPLLFAVFTRDDTSLWKGLILSPHLEKIAKVQYKGQNIVQYLAKSKKAEQYLDILSQEPGAFKKLVVDNKKTLKALSAHENTNIQKTTLFVKMGGELEHKELSVKRQKI